MKPPVKESDFPPETEFLIKDGSDPFVIVPSDEPMGDGVFSFPGGWIEKDPSNSNLGSSKRHMKFEDWVPTAEAALYRYHEFLAEEATEEAADAVRNSTRDNNCP